MEQMVQRLYEALPRVMYFLGVGQGDSADQPRLLAGNQRCIGLRDTDYLTLHSHVLDQLLKRLLEAVRLFVELLSAPV